MPRKINLPKINEWLLKKLEIYLHTEASSYRAARNKLILSLFYYQGFRVSTVQALKVKHYDPTNKILTLPYDHKRDKAIHILLHDVTVKHIDRILKLRSDSNSPLLKRIEVYPIDIPVTTRQIQRIVKEKLLRLGFPENIPPRMLRHLCSIRLTKEDLKYSSLNNIVGKVAPWVFTEYKKRAGNFKEKGVI